MEESKRPWSPWQHPTGETAWVLESERPTYKSQLCLVTVTMSICSAFLSASVLTSKIEIPRSLLMIYIV